MDLSKLSEPFPADDIEWRVSRAGTGQRGIYCMVLAYITARAIQKRLDEVCGPAHWQLTAPVLMQHDTRGAIGVGISIRFGDEWVTKWDVSELTDSNDNIPPFKGGFSGAIKRAGAQWGIGRYLYLLDETFAEVSENDPGVRGWNYARLSKTQGGATYYWKTPTLPAWALPKEPEHEITEKEFNDLKRAWRDKFAGDVKNPKDLRDGFSRFVASVVGDFPSNEFTMWTRDGWERCIARIAETHDPTDVDSDVPFGE